MSWNLNLVGHRAAVKAKVLADQNVPPALKTAIAETIDDVTPNSTGAVRVTSFGHFGGGYSSIGKLEVESVGIVLDEPAVPPTTQSESPAPAPSA